jgi:shikimate kinase / 3-dehydroquinate synthase
MYPWDGKNIYFMGFMGTGKSKVGREFASLLGWPYLDTDDLIEERAGKTITDIFEQEGEDVFRKIEGDIIKEMSQKKHTVVSLGGGAVVADENWDILNSSGLTICLSASPELIRQRISKKTHRPLVKDFTNDELLQRIKNLLNQRAGRYSMAEYSFESKKEVPASQLANTIFEKLRDDI